MNWFRICLIGVLSSALVLSSATLGHVQDKSKAKPDEMALKVVTELHTVLFKGDAKEIYKVTEKLAPSKQDFEYMFGKKYGSALRKEYLAGVKESMTKGKKSLEQIKGLEIIKIEVELVTRDDLFPFDKEFPKDVKVYDFDVTHSGGGGGGGHALFVKGKAVYLMERAFYEANEKLKAQKKDK